MSQILKVQLKAEILPFGFLVLWFVLVVFCGLLLLGVEKFFLRSSGGNGRRFVIPSDTEITDIM